MRRALLAITATLAGLAALLSFKTHSAASSASASSDSSERTAVTAQPTASLPPGEHAVTGNVANTAYGPVQVQLVVAATKIVKVNILEQPSATQEDTQIGQYAFPRLIAETLSTQSAKIDAVSGASYTSGGYIKSLQSALDNGA